MEFEVSIRPSAEKPLLEGSGKFGDVPVIMGRSSPAKIFPCRSTLEDSEAYELAKQTSEQNSITADGQS